MNCFSRLALTAALGLSLVCAGCSNGTADNSAMTGSSNVATPKPELETASDGTSISPAIYSEDDYLKLLEENYPQVAASLVDEAQQTIAIPGLDATNTFLLETEKKQSSDNSDTSVDNEETSDGTYEIDVCDQMTPQGVTVDDEHMYISAYCGKHEHFSVLYVLDKVTGEYQKTIVLGGNSHAGGIAYVEQAAGLWITTNKSSIKGDGELSLVTMADIEAYDLERDLRPIEYAKRVDLDETKAASSLTYFNGYLIVGHFEEEGLGKAVCYKLDENGIPYLNGNIAAYPEDVVTSAGGLELEQGICADDEHMYLTESYGKEHSRFYVLDVDSSKGIAGWVEFNEDDFDNNLKMPRYLEQVSSEGDTLYLIFEGAANKYRERDVPIHTDRVLKISKTKLFEQMGIE